jgi:iron complex transport system ATP-binding protein
VLTASDVAFGYRRRRAAAGFALRDLNLTITAGSLTGLLGPNGSGKTTLLKLLSGVLTPESGTVALRGRSLEEMPRRLVARRIATVPQETHPAFEFTCLEMVLMGRHPHLGAFEFEGPADFAAAEDAMGATGTMHLAQRSYMTLSGGEKQRVVIAAALAQASEILLLDEPTASLDLGFQLDIAALLRRLNRDRGVTMLLATHDVNLAAALCDRLVLLRDGRVLADGPTREVLTAPALAALYDVVAEVEQHAGSGRLTVTAVRRTSR